MKFEDLTPEQQTICNNYRVGAYEAHLKQEDVDRITTKAIAYALETTGQSKANQSFHPGVAPAAGWSNATRKATLDWLDRKERELRDELNSLKRYKSWSKWDEVAHQLDDLLKDRQRFEQEGHNWYPQD